MHLTPKPLIPPANPRVALVFKRTLYEWHMEHPADSQLNALIASQDVSVRNIKSAHDRHQRALSSTIDAWASQASIRLSVLGRELLPPALGADLVVVVGGDGTVLEVSHALSQSPLLALNSDPETSVGYLCASSAEDAALFVRRYLDGLLSQRPLQRLHALINNAPAGPPILNDVLFTHTCPAATSRYILSIDGADESQKSSGVWVSTAAGSTAAIRSAGGAAMELGDPRLQFRVREPYTKPGTHYLHTSGWVCESGELLLISRMQDAAIYLDGPHLSFSVSLGDRLSIQVAQNPLWHVFF